MPSSNKALKQLAKIHAHSTGLARHKAGGRHARQGVYLKNGQAVVRAKNKIGPAIAAQAKSLVRCKCKLLHAGGQRFADGRGAYLARSVLGVLAFIVKKIASHRLNKNGRQGFLAQNATSYFAPCEHGFHDDLVASGKNGCQHSVKPRPGCWRGPCAAKTRPYCF